MASLKRATADDFLTCINWIDARAPKTRQITGSAPLRSGGTSGYSDDHRVVIFAADESPLDHFAVYQVPIAELFQNGGRHTGVSDKPVFH